MRGWRSCVGGGSGLRRTCVAETLSGSDGARESSSPSSRRALIRSDQGQGSESPFRQDAESAERRHRRARSPLPRRLSTPLQRPVRPSLPPLTSLTPSQFLPRNRRARSHRPRLLPRLGCPPPLGPHDSRRCSIARVASEFHGSPRAGRAAGFGGGGFLRWV